MSHSEKKFTAGEAKVIGEKLGVDWSKWDVEQFRRGMDVELEHGTVDANTNVTNDDPLLTGKIALAHCTALISIVSWRGAQAAYISVAFSSARSTSRGTNIITSAR